MCAGGRVGIITSSVCGENADVPVDTRGGRQGNTDVITSCLAGGSRNVGVRDGIIDVITSSAGAVGVRVGIDVTAVSGGDREKVCGGRRESAPDSCIAKEENGVCDVAISAP